MQPFRWGNDADDEGEGDRCRDRVIAITLAAAIIILLVTFIVLFVQLDPLLRDLTSSGAMTPDTGSPIIQTPAPSPAP